MNMGSQMMDLHFWILTILLFFLTMLQLLQPYRAASELISSHKPIVALVGDDVILPCQLQPAVSVSSETLLWTRPGLVPKYIHVHRAGRQMLRNQNPSYYNRTALFVDQLMKGNVSLKLSRVKLSDAGRYHCIIDSKKMEASVQLTVGAASSPVVNITGIDRNKGAVVLQCESTGWYPEPEVFWLDGEGNLLSAGPTETVRGPDDLYTVSSRVTVEKRHSNSFTCRVQQNSTNQTRETLIHVAGFRINTCNIWGIIALFVIAGLMIIIISIFLTIWIKTFPQKIKNVVNDKNKGETSSPELSRFNDQMKEPGQLSENQLVTF